MSKLVLAGLAGCVLLAGCAPAVYQKADLDGRVVCDTDAMAKVEQAARQRLVHIIWVNCPQRTLRVS